MLTFSRSHLLTFRVPVDPAHAPAQAGHDDVLGGRVLRGRGLSRRDTRDAPWVAVVNEALARRHWPDEDPIGKTVTLVPSAGERPRVIVGVVADVRNQGMSLQSVPEMYVSHLQQPSRVAPELGRGGKATRPPSPDSSTY